MVVFGPFSCCFTSLGKFVPIQVLYWPWPFNRSVGSLCQCCTWFLFLFLGVVHLFRYFLLSDFVSVVSGFWRAGGPFFVPLVHSVWQKVCRISCNSMYVVIFRILTVFMSARFSTWKTLRGQHDNNFLAESKFYSIEHNRIISNHSRTHRCHTYLYGDVVLKHHSFSQYSTYIAYNTLKHRVWEVNGRSVVTTKLDLQSPSTMWWSLFRRFSLLLLQCRVFRRRLRLHWPRVGRGELRSPESSRRFPLLKTPWKKTTCAS